MHKLTREILNLDSKIKHLSQVYKKKDIEKLRRLQQSCRKAALSESKNEPNMT